MSCFGFGYNLDSALLDEMSSLGGGVYSFILDVGMVGTVFVHAVSNLLSCAASECIVTVEAKDGSAVDVDELVLLNPDSLVKTSSSKLTFDLGMVNYGQSRDVVVQASNPSELSVTVICKVRDLSVQMSGICLLDDYVRCSVAKARAQVVCGIVNARRLALSEELAAAQDGAGKVAEGITELKESLSGVDVDEKTEAYVSDLLLDLTGQIAMSVSRSDWFQKWGKHYLPSIQRAHMLQQCLNFKDPGMQHYGGLLFQDIRDVADDRFNELPAPTPSVSHYGGYGGGHTRAYGGTPANSAPINMACFNNAAGGCFATGLVLLASGERREVAEIAPGDRLAVGEEVVVVKSVVETRFRADQAAELVDLGDGVLATPWHPVRGADGKWQFPAEIKPTVSLHVPAVYCFFLKQGAAFTIGSWEAVALGHGLEGPVVSHPFFANRARIAEALDALPASDGRVILRAGSCLERDQDGLICGFRASDSHEDAAATKTAASAVL
jgi:hypothetical protein